jgi:hypothetical protein
MAWRHDSPRPASDVGAAQAGQGCRRVDRALTYSLTRGDPRPSDRVEMPGCYVGLQPGSREFAESDVNCISSGREAPTKQQSKAEIQCPVTRSRIKQGQNIHDFRVQVRVQTSVRPNCGKLC